MESAPHNVTTPPRTQTASISVGSGTRAAIWAGVRKMPEPIVMPMTKPTELQKPRRRLSCMTSFRVCEDRHAECSRPLRVVDADLQVSVKGGRNVAVAATKYSERVNVGRVERWLSMAAGGALAAYALKRRELPGGAAAIAGAALLYRGATGHCDVYHVLGINHANGESAREYGTGVLADRGSDTRAQLGGLRGIHVEESGTSNRPPPPRPPPLSAPTRPPSWAACAAFTGKSRCPSIGHSPSSTASGATSRTYRRS